MVALRAAAFAAALAPTITALRIRPEAIARETGPFNYPLDHTTPWPTPAPNPDDALYRHHLLGPRADDDEEITTALVGPDNICGYVDGRPGASFYCPAGNNCVLFTARTTLTGAVACCNTDACNLRLTCMDYNQVVSSSQCDNGCMVDAFTLKCTDSARPYCNTASFATSIFDYWCNDLSLSSAQTLFTTFIGQTGRSFEPLPLTTSLNIESSTIPNANSATKTDDDDDPDPTDDPGAGIGPNTPTPEPKKKVNAGAIAGGVVGGLAGLALLGLAAFFLIRRRNNSNAASTSVAPAAAGGPAPFPPQAQPPPQQPHYPPQPMQPQLVYAPLPGQPQFPNTTPSPGAWDPSKGAYFVPAGAQAASPVGPDRMSSISPHHGDPRASTLVGSPTLSTTSGAAFSPYPQQGAPGQPQPFAPNQAHVHEAGGDAADHHRGQIHELH